MFAALFGAIAAVLIAMIYTGGAVIVAGILAVMFGKSDNLGEMTKEEIIQINQLKDGE